MRRSVAPPPSSLRRRVPRAAAAIVVSRRRGLAPRRGAGRVRLGGAAGARGAADAIVVAFDPPFPPPEAEPEAAASPWGDGGDRGGGGGGGEAPRASLLPRFGRIDGGSAFGGARRTRESSAGGTSRREALGMLTLRSSAAALSFLAAAGWTTTVPSPSFAEDVGAVGSPLSSPYGIGDDVVASLAFERVLGRGSFKTVYLVSGHEEPDGRPVRYALAAERLRGKSDAKDALRGVQLAQQLQDSLRGEDGDLFERVEGWWVQSVAPPDFSPGRAAFPRPDDIEGRARRAPGRFLGSRWLISFKPAYDVDLRSFARNSPRLLPVGKEEEEGNGNSGADDPGVVGGVALTQASALSLARDICRAGRLMHGAGLVHRDIKPENVMLSRGRPVIIDFEFAQFGGTDGRDGRVCAVDPGKMKGDVRYVLARDAATFRGCREGDAYAVGKTLFEVLFGTAGGTDLSAKRAITESDARALNEEFRAMLHGDEAGSMSRFRMSREARDVLLNVIRGLCREERPITFAEAEELLMRENTFLY